MSSTYGVSHVNGYRGGNGDAYAAHVMGSKASDPTGTLVIRFLAADRLIVEEEVTHGPNDGILSGRYRYRVRLYFTRIDGGGWTLTPDSPGLPGVYHHRGRDYWCRPAPTIDRAIRAMVAGAVAVVASQQPLGRLRAEEIRATREWESAMAAVGRLHRETLAAEAAADAAAQAMHAARRALNATAHSA